MDDVIELISQSCRPVESNNWPFVVVSQFGIVLLIRHIVI